MFEAIVSGVTKFVTDSVRSVGDFARRQPWLTTAAILAVFLVW
jgi:hypothetical protein